MLVKQSRILDWQKTAWLLRSRPGPTAHWTFSSNAKWETFAVMEQNGDCVVHIKRDGIVYKGRESNDEEAWFLRPLPLRAIFLQLQVMPFTVLLASLLVSVSSTLATSIPLLEKYGFPSNPFGATAFAFLYGEPLLYYKQEFNGSTGLSLLGTNNFFVSNNGYLANASFDEVIHPNVDTLYGVAVLDFSEQDIEIYLPVYERDRVVIVDVWDP
jgi:hypothetical protein